MPTMTDVDIQGSLDAVIDTLEKEQRLFGSYTANIGELARATKQLNTKMDSGFAEVDLRFEQVDRRFEQVDRRFEQVDLRFEQVDRRFEQVDRRFEQVDRRFDEMKTEFGLVHDHLNKLDARLERIAGWIARDEQRGATDPTQN